MLELTASESRLLVIPEVGGAIAAFYRQGQPAFRAAGSFAGDPIECASFPLVPFAGRIANGQFSHDGIAVSVRPNRHEIDASNPLHGFGWLSRWEADTWTSDQGTLIHEHGTARDPETAQWPWPYRAEQEFEMMDDGFVQRLSITNLSNTDMPCGLGLHPYFPRKDASIDVSFDGVWHTDSAGIPERFEAGDFGVLDGPAWDNCFTGRKGAIRISWPDRMLTVEPDPEFAFTHVYCPEGEDFFCVEPVSHLPNGFNHSDADRETGIRVLDPGERWETVTRFRMSGVPS